RTSTDDGLGARGFYFYKADGALDYSFVVQSKVSGAAPLRTTIDNIINIAFPGESLTNPFSEFGPPKHSWVDLAFRVEIDGSVNVYCGGIGVGSIPANDSVLAALASQTAAVLTGD